MIMPRPVLISLSLLLLGIQSSVAFVVSPRIAFVVVSTPKAIFSSPAENNEPVSDGDIDQFEKDLLAAFGNEDQDDAVTNAAFSAFARDLQNVDEIDEWGKWNDDTTDDDFLISEQEAFELYTETMDDMTSGGSDDDVDNHDVPVDEKQLVADVVASANRAIESIWGEQGITNPVRDYFNDVKKAAQEGDEEVGGGEEKV